MPINLRPDQQAYLDRLVRPSSAVRFSTGAPVSGSQWDEGNERLGQFFDDKNKSQASWDRMRKLWTVAALAPIGAGAGLAAAGAGAAASPAFGVGAANTGVWGGAGMTPAAFGGTASVGLGATTGAKAGMAARLGNLFANPGFEVGTNAALSLYGQHQQNKANDRARTDLLASQKQQLELEQARLAAELNNANLDREDARALNAAIQDLEKKKFALAQEQAAFERGEYERERGIKDSYRTSIQEPAAARLRSILGLG